MRNFETKQHNSGAQLTDAHWSKNSATNFWLILLARKATAGRCSQYYCSIVWVENWNIFILSYIFFSTTFWYLSNWKSFRRFAGNNRQRIFKLEKMCRHDSRKTFVVNLCSSRIYHNKQIKISKKIKNQLVNRISFLDRKKCNSSDSK